MDTKKLYDAFEEFEDLGYIPNDPYDRFHCEFCHADLLDNDQFMVCSECSNVFDKDFVHYPLMVSQPRVRTVYKEKNHFKAILTNIQNKEVKVMPPEVIQDVKQALGDNDITPETVRRALKKLGYVKLYKHAIQITSQILGRPICKPLTIDEEQKAYDMFNDIFDRFNRADLQKRKNFLNYNFLAGYILQSIGRDDLADCCKKLKPGAHKKHMNLLNQLIEK